MVIQGRMRNLGLSTTRGRFFSRSCGVHPMKWSRGASFHAAVEKPNQNNGLFCPLTSEWRANAGAGPSGGPRTAQVIDGGSSDVLPGYG